MPVLLVFSVGFTTGTMPAVAAPAQAVVVAAVGQPCQAGTRGVDADGRRSACIALFFGRVWAWSDPIGVPPSAAVPGSWMAITTDSTGANAVPAPALISAVYADREAMAVRLTAIVNEWRAAKGIAPLAIDPRLERLSKFWAERSGTGEFVGGTGAHCPKALCAVRAMELGYTAFGEVMRPWTPIPSGDLSAERYFVDSPLHFAILTDPRYTHIGFAFHLVADVTGAQRIVLVGQVGRSR